MNISIYHNLYHFQRSGSLFLYERLESTNFTKGHIPTFPSNTALPSSCRGVYRLHKNITLHIHCFILAHLSGTCSFSPKYNFILSYK